MDRNEFMEFVYETFADEPDNVLANGIIEAADAYAEHEKAQLFSEDTTSDLIDRQAAIDALDKRFDSIPMDQTAEILKLRKDLRELPTAQPEPQEGHWIEVAGELECSECHTVFTDLYPDYADSVACPHCGAKMITK